ncbi:MAG TPA: UMP kinase [Victivallales bacterium]|nr:UMP kinase [Victivallales bacterium]HPO90743.1 UMP kinase [Victivallales bacterium]HRR06126.1 UMP kinase [Victivallales bacterium]HRR28398.1 UMP kinase [Victivallales bacterium]HRU00155.1 UMP kinase [Victivallales bacterium]
MQSQYIYNRILLKISGEKLKANDNDSVPYNADAIGNLVSSIGNLCDNGVEVAIVVGGGNIWRGAFVSKKSGFNRVNADNIGMLATVLNALCLKEAFNSAGFSSVVFSAIPIEPFVLKADHELAKKALDENKIVIFAGGTGNPFFTTDTTAALRALEINADILLKATKVDGIYNKDPKIFSDAIRYEKISYEEALEKKLEVMDSTAFSMCRDNSLPIVVFNFSDAESLEKILLGDFSSATIVN